MRLLELESSSPIFTRSLASNRLVSIERFLLQLNLPFIQVFLSSSVLPLEYPVITLRLNSSSNSSWFLGFKLGILLKNSHASFFLAWKRCFSCTCVFQNSRLRSNSAGLLFTSCCLIEASSLSVASTKSLSVSSSTAALSWDHVFNGALVVDRIRAPRNPLVGAKGLLLESTWVTVSGGALPVVWPWEGRQLLAHGSSTIVAWGCEPPAPMLGASMCPASSLSPRWPIAHRGGLFFSLRGKFCGQRRCSLYLLGHFVCLLFVPLGLPCISPPGSPSWIPLLGSSIVVHHLYPRVCAYREYFQHPCTALAWMNTISPVGALPKPKPLSTNHLSTSTFTAFD